MTSASNALAPAAPLCVLKFGGSVLTAPVDFASAAAEIYRCLRAGDKAIAIVSALQGETDALYAEAEAAGAACPSMVARLVRLGEFRSAALLGLALARIGVRVRVLDPHEIGLLAEGDPLDANLVSLDRAALDRALANADVLVAPGFTACHAEHGAAVLGRGGTDLTAVFFAARAGADRVRLIKDVDGVYTDDPARNPAAERYDRLDYDAAMKVSRGLIQPKAIEAAREAGVRIEVAAMGEGYASVVADGPQALGGRPARRPLRVALLGCGAVGSGVLDHLKSRPDLFELNPVLVRRLGSRADDGRALFTDRLDRSLSGRPDIVIELLGGAEMPTSIMEGALAAGADVVTANKAALARHFDRLHAAASDSGARLRYAAAVGGGVVALETLARLAPEGVARIEGVVNGTANFILSRLDAGADFEDALAEAQAKGFAEAEPTADVEGWDAADKLSLLVRHAFGEHLPPETIKRESLRVVTPELCAAARARGETYKQIAMARRLPAGGIEAEIRLAPVSRVHPLAGARNEENRLVVTLASGRVEALFGKGAGRWPTAASVFADVMDIARERASHTHASQLTGDELALGAALKVRA